MSLFIKNIWFVHFIQISAKIIDKRQVYSTSILVGLFNEQQLDENQNQEEIQLFSKLLMIRRVLLYYVEKFKLKVQSKCAT